MEIDYWEVAILLLFRGVLGLAVGVSLGNAWRELRARRILMGVLRLVQAAVPAGLVAFMHVSIEQYNEYPFLYWGIFALAALAGTIKTNSVLKTISIGLYVIFGGVFFLSGIAMFVSGIRLGFSIGTIIAGIVFIAIGGGVIAVLIIPYFKGESITED